MNANAGQVRSKSVEAKVNKKGGPFRGDLKGEYDTNFINLFNMNIVWKF